MVERKNNEKEEINKGLTLLAKSSLIVFVGLALSKILTYVYRIIVARYFGPEIYGLFSLAVMIFFVVVAFASFGLSEGLLRFTPIYRGKKEYQKVRKVFKFSVVFTLFSGVISAILLFFLADFISVGLFHNPDLIIFLKVFSFLIPIYLFASIFLSIVRAFEEISWYSFIFNILQNLVKVLTLILLILMSFRISAVLASYFLGIASMLVVAYLVCKRKTTKVFGKYKLRKDIRTKISKEFFSYSWPIMFFGILNTLLFWIDSFSIGYFKGALEVGLYNAAIPIAALMGVVPELFLQLFFPLINREYSKRKLEVIKQISKQVGKWIFILNLPLFWIMFFFPGAIINLLFGKEYLLAETALRFLAIGCFFSTLTFPISQNLLSMIGKSKLLLSNLVGLVVINLILNIILVPKYGINGAAISTAIVNLVLGTILIWEAKHHVSIVPIRRKMFRIFLISLIPTFLVIFLRKLIPINVIGAILLGSFFILLYLLLISITGCLDKNDFMILKNLKKKPINHNYL